MAYQTRKRHIVILGGGYAGMIAAARIARGGPDAAVTLVDARSSFVQRIRLHEALAGSRPRTLEYTPLLGRRGISFRQGSVESLDLSRQRVVARGDVGAPFELSYDELVVALGSFTAPSAPGVAAHAVRLDNLAQIAAAHARLCDLECKAGRVLVVGGGLTGIETATELAQRFPGLRITLATAGRLDDRFSARAGAYLRSRFDQSGIELRETSTVIAVEAERACFADGSSAPFDLCIWSAGFEAPALAREAGLAVDRQGRIVVDAMLRAVSQPNIFAVGDAAAARLGSRSVPTGCVSALPMGVHAGENIRRLLRGAQLAPFAFGLVIRCVSLGRRDALVQFTRADGTPRDRVWTGRRAVYTKELIGRLTLAVVDYELRSGLPLYRWYRPERSVVDSRDERPSELGGSLY